MKNRNNSPKKPLILAGIGAAFLGGAIFLMTKQVPAPTAPIEKELDAKALLEAKPVQ